jgi:flagellin
MIQRGNELAVKAANDTLSEDDRSYINAEVTKIKEEIDAIGGKTTFNEIPIFPKNGSSATDATPAQKVLLKKIEEEMIPNAVAQMVNVFGSSLGAALNNIVGAESTNGAMDLQISYIDGKGNTLALMQASLASKTGALDLFATESLLMKVDSADYTSDDLDAGTKQMLESTVAHELMHGLMYVTLPEGMANGDNDKKLNFDSWFVEGTAQLVGGGFPTNWNYALEQIAKSSDDTATKLAKVQSYLSKYTVEERVYGHGYLACAYLCQLASGQTDVNTQNLQNGANTIFSAILNNYENFNVANGYKDAINSVISGSGKTVQQVINSINNGESDAADFVLKLTEASKGSGSLKGAGSIIASSLNSSSILGSGASTKQPMYVKSSSAKSTTKSDETVLYLQVGSETAPANQIALKRFAMSAAAIGVSTANTLTRTDSLQAIEYFKGALTNLSTMRAYYGAMQNRLEHTIKNLDNVVENTTYAESRIRDTDMAAEMVRYSNNNILAQAGQAMLAQANQTNQGVLKLLQ